MTAPKHLPTYLATGATIRVDENENKNDAAHGNSHRGSSSVSRESEVGADSASTATTAAAPLFHLTKNARGGTLASTIPVPPTPPAVQSFPWETPSTVYRSSMQVDELNT